jgi:P27 family predicted phage terminase small subunit
MGKRGPARRPVELEELAGNPGKRAKADMENVVRPEPSGKVPSQPRWLPANGKAAWKYLAPVLSRYRLLTDLDRHMLEMLCYVYSEWRDAAALAKTQGRRWVNERTGYSQVNAAHVAERQLRKDFFQIAESFGMTPSGRSGLHVGLDDKREGQLRAWQAKKLGRK